METDPTATEFERFDNLITRVLSVPRDEIQRRLAEHKRKSDAAPTKRGPKKKTVPSTAPAAP